MVKYAQATRCRRAVILGYFGDADQPAHCGRCDNCGSTEDRPDSAQARAIDTPAGREVILKALSGVARTKGKFGKTVVAQMLTGSNSEKMVRTGMTRLSTFGILSHFRQPEVVQLLDAVAVAGLVLSEDVDRFRPIISLTPAGRALFKEPEGVWPDLALPDDLFAKLRIGGVGRSGPRSSQPRTSSEITPNTDEGSSETDPALKADPLYEALRGLRTGWARELGQSPFTIFTNQTLVDLVQHRPRSPHELSGIKGMGSYRMEKYGAAILEAIQANVPTAAPMDRAAPNAPRSERSAHPFGEGIDSPTVETPPSSPSEPRVSTEEWTGRLLDKGFTAVEIAQIRGVESSAILRHARLLIKSGRAMPIEAFIAAQVLTLWDERFEAGFTDPLPKWDADPALWAFFLACRQDKIR